MDITMTDESVKTGDKCHTTSRNNEQQQDITLAVPRK